MGMLAARYPTSGPRRGRLEVAEIDRPSPGAGEVLVRVAVSGVNPTDWKARATATGFDHIVPNQDGAGTIEAVGAGVDEARVGERVWLYNSQWRREQGSAAQWIALPAEQAVPLPDHASFDIGASLGIPAMTAHRCLFADGPLPPGATVLVHGGAGAVGHAAIELARWAGAGVATTVSSPQKAELAQSADLVVDYRTESTLDAVRAWAPDGVRRIVEVDLASNLETDAELIAPGAVISSYARSEHGVSPPFTLMAKNATIEFVLVYTMPDEAKRAAVADITRALRDGALTVLPVIRFPLAEIAAAHDAVESGAVGKVLVDIP
jgi:NADPH2:quinone reductase